MPDPSPTVQLRDFLALAVAARNDAQQADSTQADYAANLEAANYNVDVAACALADRIRSQALAGAAGQFDITAAGAKGAAGGGEATSVFTDHR